ncbi:MAG TPA: hypothetical protein PKV56_05565 [Burkholderiaceae bacterium]|nr:hypothetical protein [Burkholderiaceae bacterium]
MKYRFLLSCAALCLWGGPVGAAGDLTRQEPVIVELKLGQVGGEHRFTPDSLVFETGKLYVLRLENPSANAYYFGSQGLADSVYSRKVVALGPDGKVLAEVYGPVRRFELKPGSLLEWWFLPVRTGRFDDVMSTRAHTESGMRATIEIK